MRRCWWWAGNSEKLKRDCCVFNGSLVDETFGHTNCISLSEVLKLDEILWLGAFCCRVPPQPRRQCLQMLYCTFLSVYSSSRRKESKRRTLQWRIKGVLDVKNKKCERWLHHRASRHFVLVRVRGRGGLAETQPEMLRLFMSDSFVSEARRELKSERGFDGNHGGCFSPVAKLIWLAVCSLRSLHIKNNESVREEWAQLYFGFYTSILIGE